MNRQATKNQTSTLHCKPQSCHVLTELKAKISVTLIGESSKLLWYTHLNFWGLALNARFFQENQNSKHSSHIHKLQPFEALPLCWSPTPCSVSRESGSELFQSPSLLGQRLRFALLTRSSSGSSVLCPQGSQTLGPIQTNPGRTGDRRSWLDLEKQFFGRE